jgi:hypothetical protein
MLDSALPPDLVPQYDAPRPEKPSFLGRVVPWVVVYGLVLAILFFFGA